MLRAGAVSLPRDTIHSLSGASVGVGLISDVPSEVGTLVDKPLFGVALSATEPCWVAEASGLVGGCAAADVDNGIIRFFACK